MGRKRAVDTVCRAGDPRPSRALRQEGQADVPDPGIRENALRPSPAMPAAGLTRATRILVVEDEPDIGGLIAHALERDGQTSVELVGTGDAALAAIAERPPDVVVLDLNLPVLSGFEVCRILRGRPATRHLPIIMVTARTNEVDRIAGLDMGADDYVTKPFSLRELSARVRALLRRSQGPVDEAEAVYRGKQIVADFDAVSVSVDGANVRLTRREFELLKCLVENRNRVLSRERLLERVWGYDRLIETRSVDVHVGRLRAKLGSAGRQIETAVGLGYRFVE